MPLQAQYDSEQSIGFGLQLRSEAAETPNNHRPSTAANLCILKTEVTRRPVKGNSGCVRSTV